MVKGPNKFLAAMGKIKEEPPEAPAQAVVDEPAAKPKPAPSRVGAKHLGAYFDKKDPIIERVAIMRARMDMTNSELVEHALNELWKRHEAGRAFGDE